MTPPSAAPVAIVVVHWQRRAATLDCLAALARLTYPRWSLVLVDNGGSEALAAAEVERLAPGAIVCASDTNRGFAGGANLGAATALAAGAEWLWFLNNDALPEPDALAALVAAAGAAPGADLAGAKIVQHRAPDRLDSIGLDVDLAGGALRLIGHDEIDRGQYDGLSDPVAVTGCALLVSRRAWEQLGGFDESYFAYCEDADLCLRARAAGRRVIAAPQARVRHDRAPARRGRQSPDSLYYSVRNHLALLQRHSPGEPWQRKLQELRVMAASTAFAVLAGGARRANLAAVRAGIADFRRGRMGPRGA